MITEFLVDNNVLILTLCLFALGAVFIGHVICVSRQYGYNMDQFDKDFNELYQELIGLAKAVRKEGYDLDEKDGIISITKQKKNARTTRSNSTGKRKVGRPAKSKI